VTIAWGFNSRSDILTVQQSDASGNLDKAFTWTYDQVANRTSVSDLAGNVTTYGYDAKNRLTSAGTTGPNAVALTYSYDGNDNILSNNESGSPLTLNYDPANRKTTGVSASGNFTFTFDNNGNLMLVHDSTGLTTMAYDKENRLVSQQQQVDGTAMSRF
jgi:YD repeat-containing protein